MRTGAILAALAVLSFVWLPSAGAKAPPTPTARPAASPPSTAVPTPKAWILVDNATGTVIDEGNDRVPLPPASLTKLLTALVATQALQPTDGIPVSARAAGEPARSIGMKVGEVWPFRDALYALLMSSANDAAAAIGERVSGSLESFSTALSAEARQLGLADSPVLQDPAGLDDGFSVNGGNLLSARDLAIIARAAEAQPTIASVVATDIYTFTGPDGQHHRLLNHNYAFLQRYTGAIGMKTGYTRKAGNGLVAAARRGDRTLIAVVLDTPNPAGSAEALLDRGFALAQLPTGGDVLPPVRLGAAPTVASSALASPSPHPRARHHGWPWVRIGLGALAVLLAWLFIAARRREIRRRRQRRQRAAARLAAPALRQGPGPGPAGRLPAPAGRAPASPGRPPGSSRRLPGPTDRIPASSRR